MNGLNARASLLATCAVLLAVIVPLIGGCSSGSSQSDYNTGYAIGLQAYTYGLPLLETNATFLTMTSVNLTNGNGFGPVNQFNDVRKPNDPTSTAVVAPGANALSSIAWLDLTKEPQVLHVPEVTDHDFVLALLDPYTEDLRNLGSAHATPAGDYVICGPGQDGAQLPAGAQRIDVDFRRGDARKAVRDPVRGAFSLRAGRRPPQGGEEATRGGASRLHYGMRADLQRVREDTAATSEAIRGVNKSCR